jgi:hypothetical protein
MSHILRAHQLCMEGYSSLFDKHLSTVWSAPNYCYRCGNSASILEVGPGGSMYFNVFEAAPENERDGPSHQAAQNAGGKVGNQCLACFWGTFSLDLVDTKDVLTCVLAPRLLFVDALLGPVCSPPSLDVGSAITHVGPYTFIVLLVIVIVTVLMHLTSLSGTRFGRYTRVVSCLALWHIAATLRSASLGLFCVIVPLFRSCRRG